MSILPDYRLMELGPALVFPFDPNMVQPASIDVHLDKYFFEAVSGRWQTRVDPKNENNDCFDYPIEVPFGEKFIMNPGSFILASTFERLCVPRNMVARFEGKSSLARLGLLTHVTAGFIDPGFEGFITLELKNLMPVQFVLYPGMKIGQICFELMEDYAVKPYGSANGSRYQNARRGPTLSRIHQKFEKLDVY